MAIEVMRLLILAAQRDDVARISVTVCDEVATYLNNKKRREVARLEDDGQMSVQVYGRENMSPEHLVIECQDAQGREVKFNV
jgi:ribonuclease E